MRLSWAIGWLILMIGIPSGCGFHHNPTRISSLHALPYPPVIRHVMRSIVGHTRVPPLAPIWVPPGRGDLTASTEPGGVLPTSYHVNLFRTTTAVPVNAPSLEKTTVPEIASFGGDRWPSTSQAIRAVHAWNLDEGIVPPATQKVRRLILGSRHDHATLYPGLNTVQWRTGRWLWEVNGQDPGPTNVTVAWADRLARFAQEWRLPTSNGAGLVIVNLNHISPHPATQSLVIWTQGPMLYNVQTTLGPAAALHMASAMRPVPR
ncbi:MAG: hypothetical protein OWR62_12045 [Sulfobacillus thermotolerans]|nr:hypothetical protein [Sulfobacillus thermotolerans]